MSRIFCMNTIPERYPNLARSLSILLDQADIFYLNLVNYPEIPELPKSPKLQVNLVGQKGSEYRFAYYNLSETHDYYFTVDDDILYPKNYAEVMIANAEKYNHRALVCVHGTILDLTRVNNFYGPSRKGWNYKRPLETNQRVTLPGCGTLCISKRSGFKLNLEDFKVKNMSDTYIGCWAHQQKIPVYAVARKKKWLRMLPQYGNSIWGKNPHDEIDKLVRETFQ